MSGWHAKWHLTIVAYRLFSQLTVKTHPQRQCRQILWRRERRFNQPLARETSQRSVTANLSLLPTSLVFSIYWDCRPSPYWSDLYKFNLEAHGYDLLRSTQLSKPLLTMKFQYQHVSFSKVTFVETRKQDLVLSRLRVSPNGPGFSLDTSIWLTSHLYSLWDGLLHGSIC